MNIEQCQLHDLDPQGMMTQTATKSCQTFVFNLTAAIGQNSVERLASGRFADDAFSERSQRIDGPGRVEQILPQVRDPPVDFGRHLDEHFVAGQNERLLGTRFEAGFVMLARPFDGQ